MFLNKTFCLFFIFLLSITDAQAGAIDRFIERLGSQCGELNSLLVKKAMIEFHRKDGKECQARFTKIILEQCSQITCRDIKNFYRRSMSSEGGSIIGEERIR